MRNPLENLERALARLPGFGRRSAERAALAIARQGALLADPLVEAIADVRANVVCCSACGGFTPRSENPCALCADERRDRSVLCVVEEPGDIAAMERAAVFNGLYLSLHGRVSASRGTGPQDLRLEPLAERLSGGGIREVVLATGTDLDGDATAEFLTEMIRSAAPQVKVTRLAYGLPVDSGIAYSDPITLRRALSGRQQP